MDISESSSTVVTLLDTLTVLSQGLSEKFRSTEQDKINKTCASVSYLDSSMIHVFPTDH